MSLDLVLTEKTFFTIRTDAALNQQLIWTMLDDCSTPTSQLPATKMQPDNEAGNMGLDFLKLVIQPIAIKLPLNDRQIHGANESKLRFFALLNLLGLLSDEPGNLFQKEGAVTCHC